MNELERTALNEILRTVTYIAEKLDEVDSKICLCHKRASLVKPSTKMTVAVSLIARLFMMCSIICLTSFSLSLI